MTNPWSGKCGPLLIAEIGGNHMGDFDYAVRLTELAISTGVDYIKFQLYSGDTLVSRSESPDRNQHFKKFELGQEKYIQLAHMCRQAGVGYMASVWDTEYLSWIDEFLTIYKIGSGDLTAYPVLKRITQTHKPILLSTGLATLDEVKDAVAYIQSVDSLYCDPDYLALLQCTTMYPIPNRDANLAAMYALHAATGLPVGYSDHTEGTLALMTAVAMGAQVLEFHFTDRREGQTFRDHKVSLLPDEVIKLQTDIRQIVELRGDGFKRPLDSELANIDTFRRAVYPACDIPAGTCLIPVLLTTLRPNHGIDARDYDRVLGKVTRVNLKAHQKMSWDDLADAL